jgi:monoamine oxidase
MPRLTRRTFLAGTAALAAARAQAAPAFGPVDVVIVGAGAAGIAAARRITAAGRRCVIVEASDRIGGRCLTDTTVFGVPCDLGAHWLHASDINPVAKLAAQARLDLYAAPPGQNLRIGRRFARQGELEGFLAAVVRANRTIVDAGRGKTDTTCDRVLPKELGDLRPAVEFVLGPFGTSRDLADISAYDYARQTDRDPPAFSRQGLGAVMTKLAEGLDVRLSTQAKVVHSGRGLDLETTRGTINNASAMVVTASTNVLMAPDKLRFNPPLPKRYLDALAKLPLGSYERIALDLAGNPLGLEPDDLMFEMASSNRTAALLGRVSGSSLCFVDVGGKFGASLAAQGENAMVAFATDWLGELFGAEIKKAVKRAHATNWAKEPWVLGAMSAAGLNGQPMRRVLMEPIGNRIYFAGEAAHETLWGTVGGAWESGERAADAILKRYAPAAPARPAKKPRKKS